jgi:PAS domain S-box-containing protein
MPFQKKISSLLKLRIIYVSTTLFLIALSFFVFKQVEGLIDTTHLVKNTTEVSHELERLIGKLEDAETAHRSYLLTHDSTFLTPFAKGLSEYQLLLKNLHDLTKKNLVQNKNLMELERIGAAQEQFMLKILEVDKSRNPSAAEIEFGKSIMVSFRNWIDKMNQIEDELNNHRNEIFEKQSLLTPLFILTISLGALGILVFSYYNLHSELTRSLVMQNDQRLMVKEAPAFIYILRGPQHVFEMANDEYLKMIGHRNILGKPIRDALPELEGQGFYELLDNVYKTGESYTGTEVRLNINNDDILNEHYINFVYRASVNEKQEIDGVLVYGLDVTDQVLSRKKTEESESRLRIAIEGGELGTFDFIPQTNTLFWSAKTKELFGLPSDAEVDYETYIKAIHPEDKEKSAHILKSFFETQNLSMYELEYRILGINDGKVRWLRSKGKATFNAEGKPIRIAGVIQDVTQRKLAEEILKKTEDQFRNLVMGLPAAVYSSDAQGRITYYNERAAEMWGTSPQIGHDVWSELWKMYRPDGSIIPCDLSPMAIAVKEGKSIIGEEIIIERLDATRVNVLVHSQPQFSLSGEVTGAINTFIDVTEQMNALRLITESEARFRSLADSAPVLIWMSGKDKLRYYYNASWLEFTGRTMSEEAGHPIAEGIHPDDFQRCLSVYMDAFNKRAKYYMEYRLKRKDGEYRWISDHGSPRYTDGEFQGYIGACMDIHKQTTYVNVLKESENRFRSLSEALPQLVWVTNAQGISEYTSQRWKDYTGINPNEPEAWSKVVHPDDLEAINDSWMHSLSTGNFYKYEVRLKSKTGEYRWFMVNGEPIRDEGNKIIKWVGAFTDINTEREFSKQLENQVQQRTRELASKNVDLEKMNKELESFAYISSHDLQEPLRKIQTFSARILERESNGLSEKGKDYFQRMRGAAIRMQRLIEDLLTFSRASTGERKFEKVNLNTVVEDVILELKDTIVDKDALIEVKPLCEVTIIPFQFRQLLNNLIGNSLKFTRPEVTPHIIIDSQKEEINQTIFCHIRLSDNGIGFDHEYNERIFEVFQRLHGKNEYVGTGIGLAIVKKIVENHGGFIRATGEVNKGATFDIFIPSASA